MKKLLTNNIGLKLLSVFGAIVLWIIVVNVDDPIITRVYSGIPVDIVNANAITDEGKTYEVVDGSDIISVAVSAERSVIEQLSKDNIKATADLRNITFMDTVPIEIRTTRFSEKINNISSRNANISVILEDRKDKQIKLSIVTEGSVAAGYIAGDVDPVVDVIKISGPESKVNRVNKAQISVDYADMNESFTTSCPVVLLDAEGEVIDDPAVIVSKAEIRSSVEILETKEIPVTAYFVGTAAPGYGATGTVICDPSSIVIAGKGSAFEKLSSVKIPDEALSIDGAMDNAATSVDVRDYLPKGVVLADVEYDGMVAVEAVIEAHENRMIELPISKVSVVNLPENYSAHIVYGEEIIPVEVSGLMDDLSQVPVSDITGQIDAMSLMPRLTDDQEYDPLIPLYQGSNDGALILNLPAGLNQVSSISLEVIIDYKEPAEGETEKPDDVKE